MKPSLEDLLDEATETIRQQELYIQQLEALIALVREVLRPSQPQEPKYTSPNPHDDEYGGF